MPMVAKGKKYFNNSPGTDLIALNQNTFMADKPEIMTTTGDNPVAYNQNSVQPT